MGDKEEGGVKNLKKWVISFIDGPIAHIAICLNFDSEYIG